MRVIAWEYLWASMSSLRKGYESWTRFHFEDGSTIIAACPIPEDKIDQYLKAKGWQKGWKS